MSFVVSVLEQLALTLIHTASPQSLFCVVFSTWFCVWRSDTATPGQPWSLAACRTAAGHLKGAEEASSGLVTISIESAFLEICGQLHPFINLWVLFRDHGQPPLKTPSSIDSDSHESGSLMSTELSTVGQRICVTLSHSINLPGPFGQLIKHLPVRPRTRWGTRALWRLLQTCGTTCQCHYVN